MKSGVTIEGGWISDFSVRDVNLHDSVIDGGGSGNVVVIDGLADVVVDGVTIMNGSTGIYIYGSSNVEIWNSVISNLVI